MLKTISNRTECVKLFIDEHNPKRSLSSEKYSYVKNHFKSYRICQIFIDEQNPKRRLSCEKYLYVENHFK